MRTTRLPQRCSQLTCSFQLLQPPSCRRRLALLRRAAAAAARQHLGRRKQLAASCAPALGTATRPRLSAWAASCRLCGPPRCHHRRRRLRLGRLGPPRGAASSASTCPALHSRPLASQRQIHLASCMRARHMQNAHARVRSACRRAEWRARLHSAVWRLQKLRSCLLARWRRRSWRHA